MPRHLPFLAPSPLVGSLARLWLVATALTASLPVQAQVIPDATLGAGNNSVTSVNGNRTDILGGLRRNSSLFHSFERFDVLTNQQVYFANPVNIRNIFSRVTGNSISNIDGLLGVGGSANLFFMNPNGIIFGPNARLDVSGSFLATTANALEFADNQRFAATGDRAVPLVEVNIPIGLQFGANPPAMLTNRGNLTARQNLTLAAGNLDLQGQLRSGGNLTLNATDTVRIRDTVTEPFLARSGGDMTIQGDRGIDILALNHPGTPFVSGGNLSLISDGIISGDAHFTSGGNFSLRNLSGTPGNFLSLYDPIIQAIGDVEFGNYDGASLKVEATGSIRSTGNINILRADCGAGTPGCAGGIPASDADFATLTGSPALILRAGTPVAVNFNLPSAQPDLPTNFVPQPITVPGSITVTGGITATNNGVVILNAGTNGPINIGAPLVNTPNGQVPGFSIFAGSIAIDTNGALTAGGVLSVRRDGPQRAGNIVIGNNGNSNPLINDPGSRQPSSVTVGAISTRNLAPTNNGGGGDITVRTSGAFSTTGAFNTVNGQPDVLNIGDPNILSIASASSAGLSGNIDIRSSGGTVSLVNRRVSSISNSSSKGGGITLEGAAVETTGGFISSLNSSGVGGDVTLTATTGDVRAGNIDATSNSNAVDNVSANYSVIRLNSSSGSVILDRASLSTSNNLSGLAGDIFIDADREVSISNTSQIQSNGFFGRVLIGDNSSIAQVTLTDSGLSASVPPRISASTIPGRIRVSADEISVTNSRLSTQTESTSTNAGDITLTARTGEVAITDNSQIITTSAPETGNAVSTDFADISIQGRSVRVTGSSGIDASTTGDSRGGDVRLEATGGGTITLDGSSVRSRVGNTATANGGNIQVISGQVRLANGSILDASNESTGCGTGGTPCVNPVITTGGSIGINATGDVGLENNSSIRTTVELGVRGNGGNITIAQAASLSLTGGSRLDAETNGTGQAGNININNVNGSITLAGSSPSGLSSGLFTTTAQPTSGTGGDITVNATGTLQVRDRAVISAETQSTANGGNINVNVNRLEALNGGQLTTAASSSGNAGTITVTAPGGIVLSGVAPPLTTTSPFTVPGVSVQSLTNFTLAPNPDIESSTTIRHTSLVNVPGTGTFPYYGFSVTAAGSTGIFDIDAPVTIPGSPPPPPGFDTQLFLFNRDTGALLASNDDSSTALGAGGSTSPLDSYINYTFSSPGNYVIGVGRFFSFASSGRLISGNAPLPPSPPSPLGQSFTLQVSLSAQGTIGTPNNQSLTSGLFAASTGSGNAGSVTVNTGQLTVQSGATISTATTTGNSGDIRIQGAGTTPLNTLQISNGSIAATTQSGIAGDVTVNAASQVNLDGNTGRITAAASQGGRAGNVTIGEVNAPVGQFTVQNGARASVSSPVGQAGSLSVNTNDLRLNRGTLEAVSGVGDGANITLTVAPGGLLSMRNGSLISADASRLANGGNITITAPFVIGPTFEDNDIVANALDDGNGGRITITTQAIFGLQFRPNRTPRSDITASSRRGVSGVVALNTLNLDPSKGLAALPSIPVDRSNQLTEGCSTGTNSRNNESRFTIANRGGVPSSPTAPLAATTTTDDWVSLDATSQALGTVTFAKKSTMDLVAQPDRTPVLCVDAWKLQQQAHL